MRRYSNDPWEEPASDVDLLEQARIAHMWARRMLLADGEHITIAFLFRDGVKFGQVVMEPEDQRDKYLMVERLASVAAQSGADGVVVTSEAWQALALPPDDPRAELRPGQRKDRGEVLLTHALERGGRACTWASQMIREDGALTLSEPEVQPGLIPQMLYPVAAAFGDVPWEEHAAAEDA